MVINFSSIGIIKEQPTLVLCNADGTAIQTLGYAFNLKANICYNEMSTITFDIPAYVDGNKTPHYDDIIGMRIITMMDWGRFILMNPTTKNDGVKEIKSCKAYSLEYELIYKKVYFEESTYNFWNPLSPDNTVLGIMLSDLPSWSVGTVDSDLIGRYRTFSATDTNAYNLAKSTLQQSFNCIFDFNTFNRTINVRSTANEAVSKPVYLSMDNLVKEIEINEDTENIFTVLDVNGGEDVDIRMVNPMGTNKIYNLDYFMNTSQFDQTLIDKWTAWKKFFESCQLTYYNISIERMLKTSAILTEKAHLSDIEDGELAALQSERSVYVEFLAQLTDKSSDEYDEFQDKLDDVNERIRDKELEIHAQKEIISDMESDEAELTDRLKAIQNDIAFNNFFTADELVILDRYFKEESIDESTFVISNVDSYTDSDISNNIENVSIAFKNCNFSKITTDSGKTMYSISGGSLTISSGSTALTAEVVSASFERNNDSSIILSAFLNNGKIGNAAFPSGCISVTGDCSSPSISGGSTTNFTSTISLTVGTGQMYFTRNTTDYERHSVSWDLFEYGKETLASLAYPSYTFDISSANFMVIDDFINFVKQLELGQKIYLNTDDNVLQPIFIGIEIDFEKLDSLSIQFSDKYSSSDSSFKLVDLLNQSISMGKTLNSNKLSYSAFVDSGASSKVKEFMDSALDVAKNAILSSSGQGVSWDDTGLHLRKYIDSNDTSAGFEDEQIWMINNSIVFTDDGWQTAKMAIGKIIDENITRYPETSDIVFNANKTYYYKDADGIYQVWNGSESEWANKPLLYEKDNTAYGIVAPYIVGTILAGQNLVITTEDGSFRVDSSGVHIDSLKFFITHDDSEYDTTLGEELAQIKKDSDDIAKGLDEAIKDISDINTSIENIVTTYYQNNTPDNAHVGDLWYVTGDCYGEVDEVYHEGELFRYNGTSWDKITDADAIAAIEKANDAQAIADGKITSYYQNYAPYNASYGDLWYNTATSKTVKRCIEVGDNLSQVTLYFDKNKFPSSYSCLADEFIIETSDDTCNVKIYISYAGDAIFSVQQSNSVYFIYNCSTHLLIRTNITLSSFFGVVTAVDKSNPFYSSITANFTSNYIPQKLHRYNGTTWEVVEDGDIEVVKNDITHITQTLGEYITEEGYLTANKLKGAISTALSTMQNGAGNVLFDEHGIWLLNTSTKETSTSAIWMNENGILFGSGTRGYIDAEEGEDGSWTWTTAIGHTGIIADAIATKTLSAFKVHGGSINIGNGNFVVDESGNLTAKSGTFSGTLEATKIKGDMKAETGSDSWLLGCGISIGNNPTKTYGNFYVDTDGNVTMSGNINMSSGKITWSSSNSPVKAQYSTNGTSWHTAFATTDYYARYSYDGGLTWTGAIQVRGEKGEQGAQGIQGERGPRGYSGSDGSDADVTFANVNAALDLLFRTWSGGTPTTMTESYIYSPEVKGGTFYGSKFYAGTGGNGFSQMDGNGFSVYKGSSTPKIGLGCYSGQWDYPYLILGVGAGTSASSSGLVIKLGEGIWIGESSILTAGGSYPGGMSYVANISSSYPNATGVFVDFSGDKVYRYYKGVPTEIGSGTAKFG